ncbi:MAG: branched-chain amino acid aminotransferase [Tunicatimonas sp.]|uniref:branched-chain amino acid aminotransferase n=1 Tax=Tunicatimonas sp. TaxID=1940096 RepID=UPI003C70F7FC
MIPTMEIPVTRASRSKIDQVDFQNIQFGKVYSDHMFIADYDGKQWGDLRIEPFADLTMSPATSVLHYGQSIFEGLKAYKNEAGEALIFRPDRNAARFNKSAVRMCMPEIPEEIFLGGLRELIELDKDWIPDREGTSLYVRPFMIATDEYIGVRPSQTYRFMIFTGPVGAYYSKPVRVKVEKQFARASEGGTGFAKTAGNYAGSLYPAQLAAQDGYDQLIWTDANEHKYIEEAGTMNLMLVIDDTLLTPPTSGTILDGITRDSIIALAQDWGMKTDVRKISVKEIVQAIEQNRLTEAFGAGTAATVAHIQAIANDGIDYELPPIENREFSNKVLKALDDIKYGRTEDSHGWVMRVD